ncbi:helix-turn-helix domain-containing protein, partial [Vibrio cyclitrophicus]
LTWFDNKSASPDMSWVTPTVLKTLFTELITHTRGNQSKATRMLGINRGSFSKKL